MANTMATTTSARKWTWMSTTWLLFAGITAGLTFFVWMASKAVPEQKANKKAETVLSVTDPLTQLRSRNPDELNNEVKPISFDTVVRDLRNYPPEFKDSRFLKANANKWTIQIMNVAEPTVIADYLKGRDDRDKFTYFRIVDENNKKRYVLTYGLLNSTSEASSILSTTDFKLPANVKPFPEQMKLYTSEVDDYEVAEPIKDLSQNAPRAVKLQTAPKVIPAPKAKPTQPAEQTAKPKPVKQKATTEENDTIKESVDKSQTLVIQEKKVSKHEVAPKDPSEPQPLKPKVVKELKPLEDTREPAKQERPKPVNNNTNDDNPQ